MTVDTPQGWFVLTAGHRRLGQQQRFMSQQSLALQRLDAHRRRADRAWAARIDRYAVELREGLVSASEYVPPPRPGIYAMWVSAAGWADLDLGPAPQPDGAWLYVGRSKNALDVSSLGQSLTNGETRHSPFRRLLAALLADLFEWDAVPSAPPAGRRTLHGLRRVGLDEQSEWELGTWIDAYIRVADLTWPYGTIEDADLSRYDHAVRTALTPALDLNGPGTTWTDTVRRRHRRFVGSLPANPG